MTTLLQALLGAVVDGAAYGVLAAGLGLVFAVTGRLHFAMAATFVVTVYVAADMVERDLPLTLAVAVGLAVGVLLGVVVELAVYAPIVRQAPDVALLSVFVAAIGVVTLTENLLRLAWPEAVSRQLPTWLTPERIEVADGIGTTNLDLAVVASGAALLVALHLLLRRTGFGQQVRATQVNPRLALLVGISERRIRLSVFAIGSVLVAVVAVATAMRSSVTPSGGLEPTFMAVVVVFLAGASSGPLRFGAAGLAVGFAEALASVYISAAWSPIVVFGLLFAYIAATPTLARVQERRRARAAADTDDADGHSDADDSSAVLVSSGGRP